MYKGAKIYRRLSQQANEGGLSDEKFAKDFSDFSDFIVNVFLLMTTISHLAGSWNIHLTLFSKWAANLEFVDNDEEHK